jgi:hypothetical protein
MKAEQGVNRMSHMYMKVLSVPLHEILLESEQFNAEAEAALKELQASDAQDQTYETPLRVHAALKNALRSMAEQEATYAPEVQNVHDLFINGDFIGVIRAVDALRSTDIYRLNQDVLDRLLRRATILGQLLHK